MSATLRSRADVVTPTPERYAKQLVSHLDRKVPFETAGPTSTARTGTATGQVVVGDVVLTLHAVGSNTAQVARVEQVLGGHRRRLTAGNELTVTGTPV